MKLLVGSGSHDPALNLALEETLFRGAGEDAVLLWQNGPSVIVGRNQNTLSQIDIDTVTRDRLPVVRRITGGGAVYHDLGNLNYTFIEVRAEGAFGDYARYCGPVVRALRKMGCPAELSGRNDIAVEGRKVSGNAQYMWHGRMLHHGTLLFDARMDKLAEYLRTDPDKVRGKGVDSVRARVGNLKEWLPHLAMEDFVAEIARVFRDEGATPLPLNDQTLRATRDLRDSRYATWEWNFGQSPPYAFYKKEKYPQGVYECYLDVEDGTIRGVALRGDFFSMAPPEPLLGSLKGLRHSREALLPALAGQDTAAATGLSPEELLGLLL